MNKQPTHVVVDGSNLATEGRTEPSLKQLNEAVLAFINEYPSTKVTVVVDATFGYRIDRRERGEFDDAINNNELVAPPAGAVGRGDGFVLTIADKVKASVLSNDSYQEFHDQYKWLFDEGRLIGGKPVPNVGWVFIRRLPVRKQAGRQTAATLRRTSARAKDGATARANSTARANTSARANSTTKVAASAKSAQTPKLNDLASFLNFVEKNPIGTKVKGAVDSYASHGVYMKMSDVLGYLPLRLMANPVPRSAREHVKLGAVLNMVVVGYTPTRRSVELAISGIESHATQKSLVKPGQPRATKSVSARVSPSKKTRRRAQSQKSVAKKNPPNKKR